MNVPRYLPGLFWTALLLSLAVGVLGRAYWTPDEPREADLAWRMSWQADKAVPLLAGEPFCEKPPLTYWVAGATIRFFGADAWAARMPNLLYALVTALALASLGRRSAGRVAGWVAAAAISTFLLSYQVAIWLATDAPLLAAVAVAVSGLYVGFYATSTSERLRGYSLMHVALALGFLSKSAAAWMVPLLSLGTLVLWEKRFKELLRWELYVGLILQAAIIFIWIGYVYAGPDGPAHLRVFFWNNLVGRFAQVDAPQELQYAAAHRNTPGKYFIELPVYLWPWTLLVLAAARRAWQERHDAPEQRRAVRFAFATFLPTLGVLSVAATARNIYLAPALPGVALLLGWWVSRLTVSIGPWDRHALRATSFLLLIATLVLGLAVVIIGRDSWDIMPFRTLFVVVSAAGLAAAGLSALCARRLLSQGRTVTVTFALLMAYCSLLVGPASQIYRRADAWQDLRLIGREIRRDTAQHALVLFAADETTRAFIDMYTTTTAVFIPGPMGSVATAHLSEQLTHDPRSQVVVQLAGRKDGKTLQELAGVLGLKRLLSTSPPGSSDTPAWAVALRLHIAHDYSLPNGRHYAVLNLDY